MTSASKRSTYWALIIAVMLFCVAVPYWKHVSKSKLLEQRVKDGKITEAEAKSQSALIKLGLDLAGGVDLLYEATPPTGSKEVTQQMMDGLIETIRRRIDPEGVKEPVVQQIGKNRLNIQIPGETDPERTKALIGQTALLEFINAGDQPWYEGDKIVINSDGQAPEGQATDASPDAAASAETSPADQPADATTSTDETKKDETTDAKADAEKDPNRKPETRYITADKIILEGSDLKSASMNFGQMGGYQVDIEFNRKGARIFGDYTAHNVNRYLAIVLDGTVISCPVIQSVIPHGRGFISGNFTAVGAKDLATLLQSGSLPVGLKILQSRAIGPSLGKESVDLSIKAGIIGLLLMIAYIIFFYRFLGVMAVIAFLCYSFILLGLMSALGVILTLPGIAGFILSLGMADDANVIIFERIKEELNSGKTYLASIEAGFHRAWPAIMDSNVTTLITGLVLYMMGSGTIKGFAVTLNLGIIVSMFCAMVVTRALIYTWVGIPALQKPFLFGMGINTSAQK